MKVLITLTTAGSNTGPFDLYSDGDGYTTPFETNVTKAELVSGYESNLVPDDCTIIRLQSKGVCTDYIDLGIVFPTTTTTTSTSSSTTTTTTTEPPVTTTTTTTTPIPTTTTTTTSGGETTTTTTTEAPITTTTTTTMGGLTSYSTGYDASNVTTACDLSITTPNVSIFGNNADWINVTLLYSDNVGTFAPAGFYAYSGLYWEWNGSSIVGGGSCASPITTTTTTTQDLTYWSLEFCTGGASSYQLHDPNGNYNAGVVFSATPNTEPPFTYYCYVIVGTQGAQVGPAYEYADITEYADCTECQAAI